MTRDELLEKFELWFQENAQMYPAVHSMLLASYEAGFTAAVERFEEAEAEEAAIIRWVWLAEEAEITEKNLYRQR